MKTRSTAVGGRSAGSAGKERPKPKRNVLLPAEVALCTPPPPLLTRNHGASNLAAAAARRDRDSLDPSRGFLTREKSRNLADVLLGDYPHSRAREDAWDVFERLSELDRRAAIALGAARHSPTGTAGVMQSQAHVGS